MASRAYQYAKYDPNNAIVEMNKEAADNLDPNKQKRQVQDQVIYGEYNFAPILDEKKQKLQDALNELHTVVTPTLKNLTHSSNAAEIQDRVYRKLAPYENEFNACVFASKNTRDTSYCADRFASQITGDTLDYTKKILRDY